MHRIGEDGFWVRKAESRPPPDIIFIPYNRAIIHSAEDRDSNDYSTHVLTAQWLAHALVCQADSVSRYRRVLVAQHLLITLHSKWAIIRCTHPLTQRDQAHMATWPRWFRIQSHNCLSCVTWAEGLHIWLKQKNQRRPKNIWLGEIPVALDHATRRSKSYRKQLKHVVIFLTVYSTQDYNCTWSWYVFMFVFLFGVLVLLFGVFFNITRTAATALEYNRLISSEQVGQVSLLWEGLCSRLHRAVFAWWACCFGELGSLCMSPNMTDCSEQDTHCLRANMHKTNMQTREYFKVLSEGATKYRMQAPPLCSFTVNKDVLYFWKFWIRVVFTCVTPADKDFHFKKSK